MQIESLPVYQKKRRLRPSLFWVHNQGLSYIHLTASDIGTASDICCASDIGLRPVSGEYNITEAKGFNITFA